MSDQHIQALHPERMRTQAFDVRGPKASGVVVTPALQGSVVDESHWYVSILVLQKYWFDTFMFIVRSIISVSSPPYSTSRKLVVLYVFGE